jgi:hypothetical protein
MKDINTKLAVYDRVEYQRQDRDHKPLTISRGFIDQMGNTSCLILNTATGDLVAASLDRVRKVGA